MIGCIWFLTFLEAINSILFYIGFVFSVFLLSRGLWLLRTGDINWRSPGIFISIPLITLLVFLKKSEYDFITNLGFGSLMLLTTIFERNDYWRTRDDKKDIEAAKSKYEAERKEKYIIYLLYTILAEFRLRDPEDFQIAQYLNAGPDELLDLFTKYYNVSSDMFGKNIPADILAMKSIENIEDVVVNTILKYE